MEELAIALAIRGIVAPFVKQCVKLIKELGHAPKAPRKRSKRRKAHLPRKRTKMH